jgi:hypothetical protein
MDEVAAELQKLPYSEGMPVVVAVQEPDRHLGGSGGMDRILDRVVNIHPVDPHARVGMFLRVVSWRKSVIGATAGEFLRVRGGINTLRKYIQLSRAKPGRQRDGTKKGHCV